MNIRLSAAPLSISPLPFDERAAGLYSPLRYNLYNLYPPYKTPTDEFVLTFRDSKDGMELLGTRLTERLGPMMESYLSPGRDSIPAFLAAVAIAIFEQQL